MATFSSAGAYGKIPTHAEFVRLQAAEGAARPFVPWLEEAVETARRAGSQGCSDPVRFLFRAADAPAALAGVLVESMDRVGRSFPLAIFAHVQGAQLAFSFPALPRAASEFFAAATALAREAFQLAAPELVTRVQDLPVPSDARLLASAAEARALAARESGRDAFVRLFGPDDPAQRFYALHCVRTACQSVSGSETPRAAIVLDCPARSEIDRWVWLELARRGLGWAAPPSFFWRESSDPRLLVALGPTPTWLLGTVWRAGARDPRLWPLVTDQPEAVGAARRELGEEIAGALDRELSVGELVEAVMP